MKYFLIGFLFAWSNSAYGEEPKYIKLNKGQQAPFDGRLLNDAAVNKLIVDNRLKAEQCNVEIDYHKNRTKAEEKYKLDLQVAKCEAADERLNNIIEIRNDRIAELQKQIKPNRSSWWLTGGFIAGVATSISIMKAVK
jgi:hypothetical protein